MVLHVLSYKKITDREMAPTPAAPPVERWIAARAVARTNSYGTTTPGIAGRATAMMAGTSTPRRARLLRSRAGPRQPAPDGVLGHAEAGRSGLVRHRLQVTEDDRRLVGLGEPGDLLGEDRPGPGPGMIRHDFKCRAAGLGELLLVPAAAGSVGPGPGRDAMCHAVQPARERVLHPERPRLFGQHEEGGLEGVLGGMLVADHAPADAEDHRAVRSTRASKASPAPSSDPAPNRASSWASVSPAKVPRSHSR